MTIHLKKMLFAFAAMSLLAFAGCEKEPSPVVPNNHDTTGPVDPIDPPVLSSLNGTSWVGIYDDSYQGFPAELTFSLDFDEHGGTLFIELTVNGSPQQPQELAFTYSFQNNQAPCNLVNAGSFLVTYHPESGTLTADLVVGAGNGNTLGGPVTFYPRGTNPIPHSGNGGGITPGDHTDAFPAATQWTAGEVSTYTYQGTELPVDVDYQLSFDNLHGGVLQLSLSAQGQSLGVKTFPFSWTYDEGGAQGTMLMQGVPIPFSYNGTTDNITASFPFDVDGMGAFGQNVVFSR